jgi:hypothetical protein
MAEPRVVCVVPPLLLSSAHAHVVRHDSWHRLAFHTLEHSRTSGRRPRLVRVTPRTLELFIWAPRYLTHHRLTARDLVASSALTTLGIVALMFISSFAMSPWIDFYGTDYAG